jgi:signal transduction histidine kinase
MSEKTVSVLLIEDNPGDARLIQETLTQVGGGRFDLECADRLATGVERLTREPIDVVLLDLSLPDSQGLDTVRRVLEGAPAVAVVVLTGTDDNVLAAEALHVGAQDYLVKGSCDGDILARTLRHAVERGRLVRELKQRNEELDACIYTVSHELRTPLHSIWGFVRLLLAGKVQDEETQQEFLGIIDCECAHLAALVGDFLDVSKIEACRMEMRKEPLSLDELATKTVAAFKAVADEKALTIDTDLPADLPPVEGDSERLGQVLANLVSNAIKFSGDGGTIMVRARVEGPELVVSVQDQGIGIATEALPHLFERFYQVDSSGTRWRGGTGLGLYISRQIVEAHGSRIWVDSNVGEGSTFSFALPMHPSGTEDIRNDKAA